MSDRFGALIYLLSFAMSIFYIVLGFKGIRGDYTNKYFATPIIVALAGYALFPLMNTLMVLGISLWLLFRQSKEGQRG